ncbi:MAG: sodium-dependent transporter [Tepidanaerobacter sp.]|jgi:NSS family neurotransmitter:Na+ symporter|nr:sodium-dependent transporter [Tepidanaerobacter sp.]
MLKEREGFASRIGFIFAAAGSAIGLGNIWRFPWLVGAYGGAAFLAMYLIIVALVGITMFMGEVALGRYAQRSNVGAFKKVNKSFSWLGSIGLIAGFMILSFYSVVGGWVIYYCFRAVIGFNMTDPTLTEQLFVGFISNPLSPLFFHALFMALTIWICYNGVKDGIEKYSNIMMPALFVIILILAVRSLMLPNAIEGIKFYLVPDISKFSAEAALAALGQVFFSLSLGMGSILTYGSYLSKKENIPNVSLIVPLMDTTIAFIAGIVIFPAVFSYGFEPSSGAGLTFVTLPAVFSEMPLGQLFGAAFFFLLFLAALTSAISLLEPLIAYMIEEHGWSREKAALIIGGIIFIVGCFASLSMGPLSGFKIGGLVFFDQLDWVSNNLLLPIGGMLTALFISWIWGTKNVLNEVTNEGILDFGLGKFWANVMLKFIAPALVFIVFLTGLNIF